MVGSPMGPDDFESIPLDVPNAPSRPPEGSGNDRGRSGVSLLLAGLVSALSAIVVVLVAVVLLGRSDDPGEVAAVPSPDEPVQITQLESGSGNEPVAEEQETPSPESVDPAPPTTAPPPTTTAEPEPTIPRERTGTLFAGIANLRAAPSLEATSIRRIEGAQGASITILEPIDGGWYRIRYGDSEGWIFGAFVLPPDDGFAVGQTRNDAVATLRDENGSALGIENRSGNKVLVRRLGESLHEVILPQGTLAWVRASEIEIISP